MITPFLGGFQWQDVAHVLTVPAIATILLVGFLFGFFGLARMESAHGAAYLANLVCFPFFIAITLERSFEQADWEVWLGILILRFLVYGLAMWAGRCLGRRMFGTDSDACPSCGRPLDPAALAEVNAKLEERVHWHRAAIASYADCSRYSGRPHAEAP